jgi:hypothetical protein
LLTIQYLEHINLLEASVVRIAVAHYPIRSYTNQVL